ncbi:MAG: hypothetical protein ACLQVI_12730 [Polyangiaceae bacterium]
MRRRSATATFALTFGLSIAAVVAACSSSEPSSEAPAADAGSDAGTSDANGLACTPNERVVCICDPGGGTFGTAVCSEAGTTFSACTGCGDGGDATAPTNDGSAPGSDAAAPHDASTDSTVSDSGGAVVEDIVFAHAAPGVPPIRLCLGSSVGAGIVNVAAVAAIPDAPSTSLPIPPLGPFPAVPEGTPGIYPGTIRALPFQLDYAGAALSLFAVLSSSVAGDVNDDGGAGIGPDGGAEETCVALIGPHGLGAADSPPGRLVAGADFFALPDLPAGTLPATGTYLLSLTGCLPGAVSTGAATCGAGYDGGSSAQVGVAALDTVTVPDAGIAAQFAHRSSAIEGTPFFDEAGVEVHTAASSGVVPVVVTPASEIFALAPSAPAVTFGSGGVVPSPAAQVPIDPTAAGTLFGVVLVPLDGGTPNLQPYPSGDLFASPLATIQVLSAWSATTVATPATFTAGLTYTFLLVGDPAAPALTIQPPDGGPATSNPAYDGRGLHFVAFPNVFEPQIP